MSQHIFLSRSELLLARDAWCADAMLAAATYGPIAQWDISQVTDLSFLFDGNSNSACKTFNDDISQWNTSAVTTLASTFRGASAFNQPIGVWDVSRVESFSDTFQSAKAFNQSLADWDISGVSALGYMMFYSTLALSDCNKALIRASWAAKWPHKWCAACGCPLVPVPLSLSCALLTRLPPCVTPLAGIPITAPDAAGHA